MLALAKFDKTALVLKSGRTITWDACIQADQSLKTGAETLKPILKKDLKKKFGLTASEADYAHRQLLGRMKTAMVAEFNTMAASGTVGGVRMAKTKKGIVTFGLQDMGAEKAEDDTAAKAKDIAAAKALADAQAVIKANEARIAQLELLIGNPVNLTIKNQPAQVTA